MKQTLITIKSWVLGFYHFRRGTAPLPPKYNGYDNTAMRWVYPDINDNNYDSNYLTMTITKSTIGDDKNVK